MIRNTMVQRPHRVRGIAIRTLADLGARNGLYAHCPKCRHARALDVPTLLARYGALSFRRLRARLRCSRCGTRPSGLLHVWRDPTPQPAPPDRDPVAGA